MLAMKWQNYCSSIKFPVFSQPKLDGVRCIVSSQGMFSRIGKLIPSTPEIFAELHPVLEKYPSYVLDGELYNHQLNNDFNQISSLSKKNKKSKIKLEYWIFDLFTGKNEKFGQRFIKLVEIIKNSGISQQIRLVPTSLATDLDSLNELYDKYLSEGYEGQMIRQDTAYQNKRTQFLLKRKDFIDEEFILLDLEAGTGDHTNLASKAHFCTQEGVSFKAGIIGTDKYAKHLLMNKKKYIGKLATVRYQNLTPSGKPRFAKMKCLREE